MGEYIKQSQIAGGQCDQVYRWPKVIRKGQIPKALSKHFTERIMEIAVAGETRGSEAAGGLRCG